MPHPDHIIKLSERLRQRLSQLDPACPYVWKLDLSEGEFNEIQSALAQASEEDIIASQQNAMLAIVFLAEWYKRFYSDSNRTGYKATVDVEPQRIWTAAKLDEKYLYGNKWLYSIFVLGGLAIEHEMYHKSFLKKLCRILNGEDCKLDEYDEDGRAVAFIQSIKQSASLHDYLVRILSTSAMSPDNPRFNLLMKMIREANAEVMGDKFDIEWRIDIIDDNTFLRGLSVGLQAEAIGGKFRHYLRYERLAEWKIPDPGQQTTIFIDAVFMDDSGNALLRKNLMTFLNTGGYEGGFVKDDQATRTSFDGVPIDNLKGVELYAVTSDGHDYFIQKEEFGAWRQFWRKEEWGYTWTTKSNRQHQTGILFKRDVPVEMDAATRNSLRELSIIDKTGRKGESWCFVNIIDWVSVDGGVPIYNLIGNDVVSVKTYPSVIQYEQGNCVKFTDEDGDSELLPLIFGKEDLFITHFEEGKNAHTELPALVEFKLGATFREWTDTDVPPFGKVKLRITVKSDTHVLKAVYLPGPVPTRNLEENTITYATPDGQKTVKDFIEKNGEPLYPTIDIDIAGATLRILRPFDLREVLFNGRLVERGDESETIIPYLNKNGLTVSSLDKNGYTTYDCHSLSSIYPVLTNTGSNFQTQSYDQKIDAIRLDAFAPEWLMVSLGGENSEDKSGNWYLWNYDDSKEPELADVNMDTLPQNTIMFQDGNSAVNPLSVPRARTRSGGFKKPKPSALKCFELASEYRLYFFTFDALVKKADNLKEELLKPLLEIQSGKLTTYDIDNLNRLAEEFCFDWQDKFEINLQQYI